MKEVRNTDNKRIFDMSDDERVIYLRVKNCETQITANPDGTLKVTHRSIENSNKEKENIE